MHHETLRKLAAREDLNRDEIEAFIQAVSGDELGEAAIAAFLMGLLSKGVTTGETAAIARAMATHALPVRPRIRGPLLDTCGTGGGLSTFNISTATAIVCAAAGVHVAKHGSRSLSSPAGSADVLEALGVEIDLPVQAIEAMIEQIGIAFIHAPNFHPVMQRLLPIERALGIKTIFYSLIGPLINPARATHHLLGVYRADWQEMTADVVQQLGFEQAMVVHGLDGLDELSVLGPSRIIHWGPHGRSTYEIAPEDFGLSRCRLEDIATRGPQGNAELIRDIFSGRSCGSARDAILLNSAGALIVSGRVADFRTGIAMATDLIDSAQASRKLGELVEASRSLGGWQPPAKPGAGWQRLSAERIWRGILHASPDGILVLGRDGGVELANDQACRQLGLATEQVVGRPYAQLVSASAGLARLEELAQAFSSGQSLRWEDHLHDAHYDMTAIPVDDGSGVVLVSHDKTALVRAESSEQDKRARLQTLIETLPDLVWICAPDGRILNCNRKFERLLGQTESEIRGRSLDEFLPHPLALKLSHSAARALESNQAIHSLEWLVYADDGQREYSEIIQAPFLDRGVVKGVMAIARDVTAFKKTEDELHRQRANLRQLLYTDGLTRLPSRQALRERLRDLSAKGSEFSLIVISINNFARLYGHIGPSMSDAVILATGKALTGLHLSSWEIYRSSEMRFSLLSPDVIDADIVEAVVKRILERMSHPLNVGETSLFINVSIGVASYPKDGANVDQFVRNAITALNAAEQIDGMASRNYDVMMLESVQHLQWLDHHLRLAIEGRQLELHYQPKIHLSDRRIVGVEALLRWTHPERGKIPPNEFIERCESNGLIVPIGRWVIETATQQAAIWHQQGCSARIAINVSARQLGDPELLQVLGAAQIQAHGLLDIELTESCFVGQHDKTASMIHQCRKMGFGVHLDDFGTGYSSLSMLAALPLTALKIDRAFVRDIGSSGKGSALLKSMIRMAKELGLMVVAEGVESTEQADFLRRQDVELAQGWLYAPAMPTTAFERWRSAFESA